MQHHRTSEKPCPTAPSSTGRANPAFRAFAAALAFGGSLLVSLEAVPVAAARAPEPDPVPRRWQLDMTPGPLRVTTVDVNGTPRLYFYSTYKVTNGSTEDILFAPSFEMSNDQGGLTRSGREVPADVTQTILKSLDNPLLQDQIGILGVLLQGEANAKDGLVIWQAGAINADEVTVYAAGFSGETRGIDIKDPDTGEIKKVMLRKTLMMRYKMPGNLSTQGSTPLELIEKRWILR